MSRTLDALRRAEAELGARRAEAELGARRAARDAEPSPPLWASALDPRPQVPAASLPAPRPARAPFRLVASGPWRSRRIAREAARAARRADAAARQAAIVSRLDTLEHRIGGLDDTMTKQLAELEPRLLHLLELRSQGFERELARLAQRGEPAPAPASHESQPPVRALSVALLAWFGLLAFGLGVLFAQSCAG